MPKKGFLGFGEIPAKVRITYDSDNENNALSFIKTIIKGIEDYNKCRIAELKQKHILTPEECKTYREYLSNLENEVCIRYGEGEYNVREWIAVFDTHFADKDIEE